jgi:hypothetical protein
MERFPPEQNFDIEGRSSVMSRFQLAVANFHTKKENPKASFFENQRTMMASANWLSIL